MPLHEDLLPSGLLGPQPHMTTKPPTHSLSAAHAEMPKKFLPLVDLNMRTSSLDLMHGLQLLCKLGMVKRTAHSCSSPATQEVKTFSELKDSRNCLKQVKCLKSKRLSGSEGFRMSAIRAFSRNRTFVGFKVFLRMGLHRNC